MRFVSFLAVVAAFALAIFQPLSNTARAHSAGQNSGDDVQLVRSGQLKTTGKSIRYKGREKPGTIMISTAERTLTLVQRGGKARQYRIGVGRDGFDWKGRQKISRKAKWPAWYPPADMRERQPYLPTVMPGGPQNPLGARALYLGSSLYRIHGTNEYWTIGDAVSSGCFRMLNDDVIDLYNRVPVGTRVVVR